jgi:hypothetical protein
MGTIIETVEGGAPSGAVCPLCQHHNRPRAVCKHVRWTFDQGGPLEFARFAMEASPYLAGRGHRLSEIPHVWWSEHADWIVEQVMTVFDVGDGFVFGELAYLDDLTREVWKKFRPDPVRSVVRY